MDLKPYVVMAGTACMDEYYSVPEWIEEGNKTACVYLSSEIGGMIPNAACVLAGYGITTYFLDVMNHSRTTDLILNNLKQYGVNTSTVMQEETLPDAKCFLFLTEKERTVFAVNPEKSNYCPDDIQMQRLRHASILYTTLYNFQNFSCHRELLSDLKQHGVKIAFDIENNYYSKEDLSLIHQADILFFNQFGFSHYCEGKKKEFCVKELFMSGVKNITVTLGSDGCDCYTETEQLHSPGFSVDVTDPTGAGDTFNSSFLRGLLLHHTLYETALFANAAAALSVTKKGPKGGVNEIEQIQQFIAQRKNR